MERGVILRTLDETGAPVEVVAVAPTAGPPIRGPKSFSVDDLRREMGVYSPPSPDEVAQAAMAVAQEEHDEAERQKVAAATIATVACALAAMLRDAGLAPGDVVTIPRSVVDRWEGAKLGISETADRDVILRYRPRAERPIDPEEMRL
jgi:hypothetical protein